MTLSPNGGVVSLCSVLNNITECPNGSYSLRRSGYNKDDDVIVSLDASCVIQKRPEFSLSCLGGFRFICPPQLNAACFVFSSDLTLANHSMMTISIEGCHFVRMGLDVVLPKSVVTLRNTYWNGDYSHPVLDIQYCHSLTLNHTTILNAGIKIRIQNVAQSVLLYNVTIMNGRSAAEGGCIGFMPLPVSGHGDSEEGDVALIPYVSIVACLMKNCSADTNGGLLYSQRVANMHVENCTFLSGYAGGGGGAVFFIDVESSVFVNNVVWNASCGQLGGCVVFCASMMQATLPFVHIQNTNISLCYGRLGCGGLALQSVQYVARDITLEDMTVGTGPTGCAMITEGSGVMERVTFRRCKSLSESGGLSVVSPHNSTFTDLLFENVTTTGRGGGLTISNGIATITRLVMRNALSINQSGSCVSIGQNMFVTFSQVDVQCTYKNKPVALGTSSRAVGVVHVTTASQQQLMDINVFPRLRTHTDTYTLSKSLMGVAATNKDPTSSSRTSKQQLSASEQSAVYGSYVTTLSEIDRTSLASTSVLLGFTLYACPSDDDLDDDRSGDVYFTNPIPITINGSFHFGGAV
eukprot:PhF_6_TR26207/c0_g1_i3/m.37335